MAEDYAVCLQLLEPRGAWASRQPYTFGQFLYGLARPRRDLCQDAQVEAVDLHRFAGCPCHRGSSPSFTGESYCNGTGLPSPDFRRHHSEIEAIRAFE
jgi:hypothetical protein